MNTKNGHILTFSEKMQISAILCFATCDWFCPMTSQMINYVAYCGGPTVGYCHLPNYFGLNEDISTIAPQRKNRNITRI